MCSYWKHRRVELGTLYAKILEALLARGGRGGEEELAQLLGVTRRTIAAHLQGLREVGWISVARPTRPLEYEVHVDRLPRALPYLVAALAAAQRDAVEGRQDV